MKYLEEGCTHEEANPRPRGGVAAVPLLKKKGGKRVK
jgi:hypothetical protein